MLERREIEIKTENDNIVTKDSIDTTVEGRSRCFVSFSVLKNRKIKSLSFSACILSTDFNRCCCWIASLILLPDATFCI